MNKVLLILAILFGLICTYVAAPVFLAITYFAILAAIFIFTWVCVAMAAVVFLATALADITFDSGVLK